MMKMAIGAQWKCDTQSRFNSLAFSTPRNHFRSSNVVTIPVVFYFMRFPVSR